MKIVKLNLLTKNNKQNGFYVYSPIVKIDGKYYYCESIKSSSKLKISDINPVIKRQIQPQFYAANGIS